MRLIISLLFIFLASSAFAQHYDCNEALQYAKRTTNLSKTYYGKEVLASSLSTMSIQEVRRELGSSASFPLKGVLISGSMSAKSFDYLKKRTERNKYKEQTIRYKET